MLEQGETWTMENDQRYTVASIVEENDKKYVYLLNRDDYKDYIIGEYVEDEVVFVEDPGLISHLVLKFNKDLKENLPRMLLENM